MVSGRKLEFDRDEIVERAAELFWKQGYQATGVTELLEHLGIGRQSLYNTFGDKKSLYLETLSFYFDGRRRLASEISARPGSRLKRLEELILAIIDVDVACEHPGCLLGNSLAEFGARDPDIEKALGGYLDTFRELIESLLEEAQKHGELSETASPGDVARSLLVMSQGLLLLNQNERLRKSGVAEAVLRTTTAMMNPSS